MPQNPVGVECSERTISAPRGEVTLRRANALRAAHPGERAGAGGLGDDDRQVVRDDVVQLAEGALGRCGFAVTYALSGGGADANVFNERGLACVNLANGMVDIHTPDERIAVADLERSDLPGVARMLVNIGD